MRSTAAPVVVSGRGDQGLIARLRGQFLSSPSRGLQTGLGLIWLLDGGLQFQSFMYSRGFTAMLRANAVGQPGWVHDSILWAVGLVGAHLGVWNSLWAGLQVLIGLGLLWRPTVRAALMLNIAWALGVWWFGEGFGMMLVPTAASPLTGAPGAAALYVLVGLLAWPDRPGGLLGVRGARTAWAGLWLVLAWLWLEPASAAPDAIREMLDAAPSGLDWLSRLQHGAASLSAGLGVPIALVLAALSATIAVAVAADWRARGWLWFAVALNLVFWFLGQGLGGIFQGGATDPNSGPLMVLLSLNLLWLVRSAPDPAPSAAAWQQNA
ncbi:MAG TPA: hypothetical protein VFN48_11810 [Solirubrobacteraceae bacterium]|nr:hypothetical protein [Solirubrobacteraceae bacterium]